MPRRKSRLVRNAKPRTRSGKGVLDVPWEERARATRGLVGLELAGETGVKAPVPNGVLDSLSVDLSVYVGE